jgi:signal transduction histidine kinase/tetratricopeptide (TPR) repeat protein/ActR/RegA family two-component response regulator
VNAGEIDSLKDAMKRASGEERIDLMIRISELELETTGVRNLEILSDAILLSSEINVPLKEAKARLAYSIISKYKVSSKIRMYHLEEAFKIAESLHDKDMQGHILNQMGGVYFDNSDFGKAIEYYKQSLDVFKEAKDSVSVCKLYNNLGYCVYQRGEDSKALSYYNAALSILYKQENNNIMGVVLSNMAQLYFANGNMDLAIYYYNRVEQLDVRDVTRWENELYLAKIELKRQNLTSALQKSLEVLAKAQEFEYVELEILANLNLADLYRNFTQYSKALNFAKLALQIAERKQIRLEEANALRLIGNIYSDSQEYEAAREFYNKALELYETIEHKDGVAACYNNLGRIYARKGKFEAALEIYQKSLEIKELIGNRIGRATTLFNIAEANYMLGNYNVANAYADSSLQITTELSFKDLQIFLFILKGSLSLESELLEEAEYYYQNALRLSEESKSQDHILTSLKKLSELSARQGNNARAYSYLLKYNELRDSSLNKYSVKAMAEFKAQYETSDMERKLVQKDIELATNEEKLQAKQRFLMLVVAAIVILLVGLSLFFIQNRTIRRKNEEIEEINNELDAKVRSRTMELRLTKFAVENAAVAMLWTDKNLQVLFANESTGKMFDIKPEEFVDLNLKEIDPILAEDADIFDRLRARKSLKYETNYNFNGLLLDVECMMSYLSFDDKEYAFVFMVDIGERKDHERMLRHAKQKAEESDKLKTAFLANMSHEIRTPMNAILGFSDLLMEEDVEADERTELLQMIKKSGDELVNLIDDIIDISMIESGQLKLNYKETDIPQLVNERFRFYTELIYTKIKKDITLLLDVPKDPVFQYVLTDPFRLTQVLNNLLSNALKFTDFGEIELGYKEMNGALEFYVRDTGIGIQKKLLPYVFERFRKEESVSNRLFRGAGLGLAISKNLLELMDGEIWVESEEGKGSTFYFRLPAASITKAVIENPNGAQHQEAYNWEDKKILIVEDTSSNFQLLKSYLRKTHLKIEHAKLSAEAFDILNKDSFDIILLDVQLPDGNGLEIVKELRANGYTTPVIAQTAYAFNGEREKCINAGCNEYLSKPIKKSELLACLSEFIQESNSLIDG